MALKFEQIVDEIAVYSCEGQRIGEIILFDNEYMFQAVMHIYDSVELLDIAHKLQELNPDECTVE